MNDIVKKFIDGKQSEIDTEKLERRNDHLIKLGLVDKSKSTREYINGWQESAKYDTEKQKYYIGNYVPTEITNEEYDLICKYCPEPQEECGNESKLTDNIIIIRKWIQFIGIVILVGLIISVISGIAIGLS